MPSTVPAPERENCLDPSWNQDRPAPAGGTRLCPAVDFGGVEVCTTGEAPGETLSGLREGQQDLGGLSWVSEAPSHLTGGANCC